MTTCLVALLGHVRQYVGIVIECSREERLLGASLAFRALLKRYEKSPISRVILCNLTGYIVAQKKTTLLGDLVIGEVVKADETAREITIKYSGKEGTEIFDGILAEGYKLRMEDGSVGKWQLSDLTPGMRVRVFYKTDQQKVSGQKRKVHRIVRLDFLGKDEYVRLREQLNVDPSTAFARAEHDSLPPVSPLKVYLAIKYAKVHETLVDWLNKWNRKQGETYGMFELVSNLEQADMSIVVSKGSDSMVAVLPAQIGYGGNVIEGEWSHATSYLVIKDPAGLKVLWVGVAPVWSSGKVEVSIKSNQLIENEIEKRMKARRGPVKK